MKNITILSAVGLMTFAAQALSPAAAADLGMLPPAAPIEKSEPLMEWGSGWYLRGDIGYSQDTGVTVDNGLYSAQTSAARKRTFPFGSLGVGYQLNDWFRIDATYERFGSRIRSQNTQQVVCPYSASGLSNADGSVLLGYAYNPSDTCNEISHSRLGLQGGMVNGYVDLGRFAMFSPYVGAGFGVFRQEATASREYRRTSDNTPYAADLSPTGTYPLLWVSPSTGQVVPTWRNIAFARQNWNTTYRKTTYRMGWALMAGVGIDVAEGLKLDIGYRYMNAGKFESVPDASGKIKKQNLDNHQIRVGIRYQID